MDSILVIGCTGGQRQTIKRKVKGIYNPCFANTHQETISVMNATRISLILVDFDTDIDLKLVNLNFLSTHPDYIDYPVMILTDNSASCQMELAFEKGAIDYVTYGMRPALFCNRLHNCISLRTKRYNGSNGIDNAYLFHNCVGPALMLAAKDEKLTLIRVNDAYYRMLGVDNKFYDHYRDDMMKTVLPDEKGTVRNAISEARRSGASRCILHDDSTNRAFQITYHRVGFDGDTVILFVTAEECTNQIKQELSYNAFRNLPNMIMFYYDVEQDFITFYIGTASKQKHITTEHLMDSFGHISWLAPESCSLFWQNWQEAIQAETSGSFEIRACFGGSVYLWYRIFYRSITDRNGKVFNIVGRVDDLESSVWFGVRDTNVGLCDIETHLLTYHALQSYINKLFLENKHGTLLLIKICALEEICRSFQDSDRFAFLRDLADSIKKLFFPTDIIGRYNNDSFIVFLPDIGEESLASKRSIEVIQLVQSKLADFESYNFSCNIGIATVNDSEISIHSLLEEANQALIHSLVNGKFNYAFYRPDSEL